MHEYAVRGSREHFQGRVITVVSDEVAMPGGGTSTRDYVRHPGAVGVIALDERGRVLLIRQYRHPVRTVLWEAPAGLLDVDGEPALEAAQRELYEEGAVRARQWNVLADAYTSPGMSDEAIRVFLARDLEHVPHADRFVGEDEEADLELHWIDLDEARRMALAGEIQNALCLVGVLAAVTARDAGWQSLRPADAPWPARPDVAADT